MAKVITVEIESRKDVHHYRAEDESVKPGDYVIVKSLTGEEMGQVLKAFGTVFDHIKNIATIPDILRKASDRDLETFRRKKDDEHRAFEFCVKKVSEREIPIKIVKVTYFTSERKAIFYFSSEGRIDFRDLVKDLAKRFKMRIEMRQIGIRDEAKMIGGLGVCGRQLCCKTFLNSIEPITLQMAKRQNINMNPVKISGQCGRLMCCLSYEEDCGGRVFIEDQDDLIGYDEEGQLNTDES